MALRSWKFADTLPCQSFLLSQIALSGIPLALFAVMTITVFVFALLAALVIGLLGALLFTAFCVGVALLILLPTLFITTFGAAFIWLWGVGTYYIIKWFNQKEIPGIHTGFVEGIMGKLDESGSEKSESAANGEPKKSHSHTHSQPKKLEPSREHKSEKKSNHTSNGVAEKLPGVDKVGDLGKTTGVDGGQVGELKKKADVGNVSKTADLGNVKSSVPGGVLS